MSQPLKVIKSIGVTDAMLVNTSLPENDYAEWAAPTTYAAGARVILAGAHKVYESIQAGNVGNAPATAADWWVEVGPTNRWKAFDLSNTSQTVTGVSDFYDLTPGQAANAVALINISGLLTIRLTLTDPDWGVVYDKTADVAPTISESSWYAWFFEPRKPITDFIATDLPSYPNATLRVTLTSSAQGNVGAIVIGSLRTIGRTVRNGARLGIQDFSRKERNLFGDTVLVQRAFAKRTSLNVLVDNDQLDNTYTLLSEMRATPCVWVASPRYTSLVIFGFYNNFEILIPYARHSECSIDIEGLA